MSQSHRNGSHRNSLSLLQDKKSKLIQQCKKYGLPADGSSSKNEMVERILKHELTSIDSAPQTPKAALSRKPKKPKASKSRSVDRSDAAAGHAFSSHKPTYSTPLRSTVSESFSIEAPNNVAVLVTLPDEEATPEPLTEQKTAVESDEMVLSSLDNSAALERVMALKGERRNRQKKLDFDFEQLADNGVVSVLLCSSADDDTQELSPKVAAPANDDAPLSPMNDEGKNEDPDSFDDAHSEAGADESEVKNSQEKANVYEAARVSANASEQNQEGPQQLFAQIAVAGIYDPIHPKLKKVLGPISEMNAKLVQMVDDKQLSKDDEAVAQILGFVQELNSKTAELLSRIAKSNHMDGSAPGEEKEESLDGLQHKKRLSMQLREIGELENVATAIGPKYGDKYAAEWNTTIVTHVESHQQSLKNSALKPIAVDYVHSLLENNGNNEGFDRLLRMIQHNEGKLQTKQSPY